MRPAMQKTASCLGERRGPPTVFGDGNKPGTNQFMSDGPAQGWRAAPVAWLRKALERPDRCMAQFDWLKVSRLGHVSFL